VTADDLDTPLGLGAKKAPRFKLPFTASQAIAAALAIPVVAFGLWTAFASAPYGGEPVVIVSAEVAMPAPNKAAGADVAAHPPSPDANSPAGATPPGGAQTVTIINGMSGKREQVVIAGGRDGDAPGADARITENSRHGPIPRIGADGARASEVYARRPPAGADGPRIAIVVEGLGISATGTAEALGKLPGPVTLAFAPYGSDLARWVARARSDGHEILLQVPLEPFDYPDNDPGPQTLLTTLPAAQNLDRLHWFMSRLQGYVGLANHMGARFTSNEPAMSALLRETGRRGLIYFDDGSSARSVTGQVAGSANVPFAKADVVLDALPTPAGIDAALAKLEALARERGIAVGAAAALPVAVSRIAQWAKAAESRGLTLVPITAVALKPKSS
jgi:uncharacterized protein